MIANTPGAAWGNYSHVAKKGIERKILTSVMCKGNDYSR